MNDPIKIIHKYKNNNRKVQYHCYIYVGAYLPNNIKKILIKIQDLNLFDTLNTITKNDYQAVEDYYGNYWYEKIFLSYHVIRQKDQINNNASRKKLLEKKFGKEWLNTHMNNYQINRKKILYN